MSETIGDWGEKRLVAELGRIIGQGADAIVGIGDDAAVVDFPHPNALVVSTDRVPGDLLAWRLELISPYELGRYLVEVNVSDIIAMGATPHAFLLNLGFPAAYPVEDFFDLIRGAAERATELGAPIVGGDTKSAASPELVGVAIGYVKRSRMVTRRGAMPGDVLAVSGPVGGFGAAITYYYRRDRDLKLDETTEVELRRCLTRPVARVDLAALLFDSCTACIDITDGLAESIRELERAASCEFEIDLALIPLHPAVQMVADLLAIDPYEIALGIGLDLELLCTVRADFPLLPGMTSIGHAHESRGLGSQVKSGNELSPLTSLGFQHFSADAATFIAGSS
ncbi:thiamine-phosphate kinase [Nocardia sp. NPDC006044]|uniref:thiamine-phosphate kinase n=1 Tax=Nocardia sp. NPDC006044 TaxID=3364306 RepID=UPI003677C19D